LPKKQHDYKQVASQYRCVGQLTRIGLQVGSHWLHLSFEGRSRLEPKVSNSRRSLAPSTSFLKSQHPRLASPNIVMGYLYQWSILLALAFIGQSQPDKHRHDTQTLPDYVTKYGTYFCVLHRLYSEPNTKYEMLNMLPSSPCMASFGGYFQT
jgi:hypothetical protein